LKFEPLDAIKDPLYGYVEINDTEKRIIDHPLFQRLRYIYQLQVTYFTYPSAVHTRFAHSVGVMHIAHLFAEHLLRKFVEMYGKEEFLKYASLYSNEVPELSDVEETITYLTQAIKLAALLHDIGHGPFSHAFDNAIFKRILIVAPKDDINIDTIEILDAKTLESREDKNKFVAIRINHEIWGFLIVFLTDLLDDVETELRNLVLLFFMPTFPNKTQAELFVSFLRKIMKNGWRKSWLDGFGELFYEEKYRLIWPFGFTLRYIYRGFPWCADIIDYVLRDSYFSGTMEYGWIDWRRLIKYSRLIKNEERRGIPPIFIAIDSRAKDAILNFMIARYFMYSAVYLHRTTRRHESILRKLLAKLDEIFRIKEKIKDALSGTRDNFLSFIYGEWITIFTDLSFLSNIEFNTWDELERSLISKLDDYEEKRISELYKILFYTFILRQRTRIYNFLEEIDFFYRRTIQTSEIQKDTLPPFEEYYNQKFDGAIHVPFESRIRGQEIERIKSELIEILSREVKKNIKYDHTQAQKILKGFIDYFSYRLQITSLKNYKKIVNNLLETLKEVLENELEPILVDIIFVDIIPSGLTQEASIVYIYKIDGKHIDIEPTPLISMLPITQFRRIRVRIYVLANVPNGMKRNEIMKIVYRILKSKFAPTRRQKTEFEETM